VTTLSSELTKLDPYDDQAVADLHQLQLATEPVDRPWSPTPLLSDLAGDLRYGWDGETGDRWLFRDGDGAVIGVLYFHLPQRENLHLVDLGVLVHPEHRRKGLGTRLHEAGLEMARQSGRRMLDAWTVDAPAPIGFAERFGYSRVYVGVHRRQDLTEVDWEQVEVLRQQAVEAAADYRLLRFVGRVPDNMLDDVAVMAAAINDAPTDEAEIDDDVIDGARVRAYEDALASRGLKLYRLIAQRVSDGELAGTSVVAVNPERPEWAEQHDTSVVAAHRGRRLGMLLKAEMMRWLNEYEPKVRYIDTGNAQSNNFMIKINEQLGYRIVNRGLGWQRNIT
jgi:RimJ/RimL family protein N-acetyltransferase